MDFILIDGDKAKFNNLFGLAVVDVQDGTLTASGFATIGGAKICVEGDEASVRVSGCGYTTPTHTIKGAGDITIDSLGPDQVASQTTSEGTPVMLVGSLFTAKFSVTSPAQQPVPGSSPVPDAAPSYVGNGTFETQNDAFRGE